MTSREVLDKIKEDSKTNPQLPLATGAFGDTDFAHALVERVETPDSGGTFMYLYGCAYPLVGFPEKSVVEAFGLPKAMISSIPREILTKSLPLMIALGWTYVFTPKKFIHFLHVYFTAIYSNWIEKLNIPAIRYNKVSVELKRAVYSVIERRYPSGFLQRDHTYRRGNREVAELIAKMTEFFCLFLELDSAYRFPFQDVVAGIDKKVFEKSVTKGMRGVLNLMSERWTSPTLKEKPKAISKLLIPILFLSPEIRGWIGEIIQELRLENIKMTEADWYFCLERRQYNYAGFDFDTRMKVREAMDIQKGNARLKFSLHPQGGMEINA